MSRENTSHSYSKLIMIVLLYDVKHDFEKTLQQGISYCTMALIKRNDSIYSRWDCILSTIDLAIIYDIWTWKRSCIKYGSTSMQIDRIKHLWPSRYLNCASWYDCATPRWKATLGFWNAHDVRMRKGFTKSFYKMFVIKSFVLIWLIYKESNIAPLRSDTMLVQ